MWEDDRVESFKTIICKGWVGSFLTLLKWESASRNQKSLKHGISIARILFYGPKKARQWKVDIRLLWCNHWTSGFWGSGFLTSGLMTSGLMASDNGQWLYDQWLYGQWLLGQWLYGQWLFGQWFMASGFLAVAFWPEITPSNSDDLMSYPIVW